MTLVPTSARGGGARQATVLVIAGLDPSGGAGLLADARVVLEHGLHAAGVATAVTEQDSLSCARMHPLSAERVAGQLARLIDDFEVRAIKVGMLANPSVARAVAALLRQWVDAGIPVIVDPVLRATKGASLFDGAPAALAPILEVATLLTPNLDELRELAACPIGGRAEMGAAARRLRARGPRAVLAKGGHLDGDPVDVLVDEAGELEIPGRRIEGAAPHGTGCALSAEIACRMALGAPLRAAVIASCERVRQRIAAARAVGRGRPFLG